MWAAPIRFVLCWVLTFWGHCRGLWCEKFLQRLGFLSILQTSLGKYTLLSVANLGIIFGLSHIMRIFLPSFLFKCPFYGCFIPSVWFLLGILLDESRVLFAASLGLAYGKGLNLWSIGEASAVGRECGWGSAERDGKWYGRLRLIVVVTTKSKLPLDRASSGSSGVVDGQMEVLFSVADGAKARLGMVAHAYI